MTTPTYTDRLFTALLLNLWFCVSCKPEPIKPIPESCHHVHTINGKVHEVGRLNPEHLYGFAYGYRIDGKFYAQQQIIKIQKIQ